MSAAEQIVDTLLSEDWRENLRSKMSQKLGPEWDKKIDKNLAAYDKTGEEAKTAAAYKKKRYDQWRRISMRRKKANRIHFAVPSST